MLVSVPFDYRLHGFPTDYRRFRASGLYTLLEEFPQKTVFAIGPHLMPSTVFAIVATSGGDFEKCEQRLKTTLVQAFRRHKRRRALKVWRSAVVASLACCWAAPALALPFSTPNNLGVIDRVLQATRHGPRGSWSPGSSALRIALRAGVLAYNSSEDLGERSGTKRIEC